jgi:putative ABC transport system ATP-binding protein
MVALAMVQEWVEKASSPHRSSDFALGLRDKMSNRDLLPPENSGAQHKSTSGANSSAPDSVLVDAQPTQPVVSTQFDQTTEVALNGAIPAQDQPTQPQSPLMASSTSSRKPAPVIAVRDLYKTYMIGRHTEVPALRGVSLEVYPGEFVAIMGPSGSGKSTFMNLVGCLDRPTRGEYWLTGKLVSRMSTDELANIRNELIGFVFQGFNLLGRATAMKNVELPMVYAGISKRVRERRARKALQLVGLGGRLYHKPSELSGGQQQRVAIARSLVNGPYLLLADEPTGNLDSRTSIEIMGVIQALNEQGLTIVLVTHDLKIAQYAKRQVSFLDGRIVRDEPVASPRLAIEEWNALMNADKQEDEQPKEETV